MRSRTRWTLLVLAIALVAGGLLWTLNKKRGAGPPRPDLDTEVVELAVYVLGAERMLAGEEVYRPSDKKPFTYPPFVALPFVPLVPLAEPWRRTVFYLLNVGALGCILWLVHRARELQVRPHGGGASPRRVMTFWILVALLSGRHVAAVFENQSHDLLVFVALMAGIDRWMRARDLVAGAWFGLAAAMKATPLLFLVPFVLQLRVRAVLALCGTAVAATLLADLLLPRAGGGLWVQAWIDTFVAKVDPGRAAQAEGAWSAGAILNQSLSGTLTRLTTPMAPAPPWVFDVALGDPPEPVRKGILLGAQLLVLALIAFVTWPPLWRHMPRVAQPGQRLGEAGMVLCGMVLLSPMSSKSHFDVLLVPFAFVVGDWLWRRTDVVVAILLAGAFVGGTLTAKGLVDRELGNLLLAYGSVTWTAVLALLAAAWALVGRARTLRLAA